MITERLMLPGQWSVKLSEDTPRTVMELVEPHRPGVGFGLLVVTSSRTDPATVSDATMMSLARYAGPVTRQPGEFELSGVGVNTYMGDTSGKGIFFSSLSVASPYSFALWAAALRPSFLTAGITSSIAGAFNKTYTNVTIGTPLEEVADRFAAEWRVTPDLKLDFGTIAALYRTTPIAMVVRKNGGREFGMIGIPGELGLSRDVEDWTREVKYLSGTTPTVTTANGSVTTANVPYRAPDGTALPMTRIVTAGTIPAGSEQNMADSEYGTTSAAHQELSLSTDQYDVGVDVRVGDNIFVYDETRGLVDDNATAVYYNGAWLKPITIRCVGLRWALRTGMGVYLRRHRSNGTATWDREWVDLTDYVQFEDNASTTVEVGALPRPY